MTLYPFYPQGGDEYNMQFGTALFTQGVPPESLTEKRWRHIYVRQNQGGDSEYSWASNGLGGSIDSKAVYVKRHEFPWKRVGKLADYDSISKKYPFADWEWGSTYNGDVQKMTMNGWNRGAARAFRCPLAPSQRTPCCLARRRAAACAALPCVCVRARVRVCVCVCAPLGRARPRSNPEE